MLDKEILLNISRPARYINHELNATHHYVDNNDGLKFCLAYPDIYEVGMSNLGFRIIYDLLNKIPDVLCARAFLPWIDLEKIMRERDLTLCSLESDIPLGDFDCVGVSLQTEMNYTGLLNLLDLGKIPLFRQEREGNYPLIIAGGPCCVNPEPLADFVDLFVVGEAEELIQEIINSLKKWRYAIRNTPARQDLLFELAKIEGVYIPAFYSVEYCADGRIKNISPKHTGVSQKIKKRIVRNLNDAPYPKKTILPYIEVIHDRIGIEIMRGCPHRCRFCQARNLYFPRRERSLETVVDLAMGNFRSTGYEDISLLSLSSLDHSQIQGIFSYLSRVLKNKAVGLSLSSLKANPVMKELIKNYPGMWRSGLTFAPEAGSERLRRIINKNINIQLIYEIVEEAFSLGWKGVKFYFMTGLPGETEEDLEAIVEIVFKILEIKKKTGQYSGKVNLSFNAFIPKAHTVFQWLPMQKTETLLRTESYLKNKFKNRLLRYSFNNLYVSWVEALLSRGDRRLGRVLFNVWQKGASLEAWKERFNFRLWQDALREEKINPDFYLYRLRMSDEIFPWEHIDIGIEKEEFSNEYQSLQESL
jgi:radical SAM family uncharacterized protein